MTKSEVASGERLAYSIKEAAAIAGVSVHTLYRAVGEGKLMPKRLGSRTLIPADRLRDFLNGLEDATPRPGPKSKKRG
jgi:excisionase family DNA binding protein